MLKAIVNMPDSARRDVVERVLLVDSDPGLRDLSLLLNSPQLFVDAVRGYSEVFRLGDENRYTVVVLSERRNDHQTFQIAEYVRTRWPDAKILILGDSCGDLDDWLYDDIVDPTCNTAGFIQAVQRLLEWARTGRIHR